LAQFSGILYHIKSLNGIQTALTLTYIMNNEIYIINNKIQPKQKIKSVFFRVFIVYHSPLSIKKYSLAV
jgi:hypothetical protein